MGVVEPTAALGIFHALTQILLANPIAKVLPRFIAHSPDLPGVDLADAGFQPSQVATPAILAGGFGPQGVGLN